MVLRVMKGDIGWTRSEVVAVGVVEDQVVISYVPCKRTELVLSVFSSLIYFYLSSYLHRFNLFIAIKEAASIISRRTNVIYVALLDCYSCTRNILTTP